MKDIKFLTGCEDFSRIIEENAYYVDKTAYLKTLFLSTSEVMNSLFIRPRRFGKTLNMRMIEAFCTLNYQNPGDKSFQHKLFVDNGRNLAVAGDKFKELRDKVMGEYPVISISFKGVEGRTFHSAVASLLGIISELYGRFLFLRESDRQSAEIKDRFSYIYGFSTTKS
ncbi:MAG: AAA family ATPase, partial [Succinivibrio sp.]|nr:AAA family ATPase [Succinivibrio sp.]